MKQKIIASSSIIEKNCKDLEKIIFSLHKALTYKLQFSPEQTDTYRSKEYIFRGKVLVDLIIGNPERFEQALSLYQKDNRADFIVKEMKFLFFVLGSIDRHNGFSVSEIPDPIAFAFVQNKYPNKYSYIQTPHGKVILFVNGWMNTHEKQDVAACFHSEYDKDAVRELHKRANMLDFKSHCDSLCIKYSLPKQPSESSRAQYEAFILKHADVQLMKKLMNTYWIHDQLEFQWGE